MNLIYVGEFHSRIKVTQDELYSKCYDQGLCPKWPPDPYECQDVGPGPSLLDLDDWGQVRSQLLSIYEFIV